MVRTMNLMTYKAFGLTVRSEFPLPELPELEGLEDTPDLFIVTADLSDLWEQLARQQVNTIVRDNLVLFRIPNSATYCIRGGNQILVSPMQQADFDEIRLYILGTCMGIMLLQRKVLPLHGSAVAIKGKAYAFVGESGAGKSTLASAFLGMGYPLVSDDVIAVSLSKPDQTPMVTPAYPQQKLWQESLESLGMDRDQYRPIYQRETKYCVPVVSQFASEPLPLAGLFELVKGREEKIHLTKVGSLHRLAILYRHTFRSFLIHRLGLLEWHLNLTAGMANQIEFYKLQRPVMEFTAPELAALLLSTIEKEG